MAVTLWESLLSTRPRETCIFAGQLGLKSCFAPVKSPQSNGISEAFVKTLKRGYVQVSPLPDAKTALGLIAAWFEDYNESHPHSGLKMRSPREFIAAQTAYEWLSEST
jgi:transposase InsO family protein